MSEPIKTKRIGSADVVLLPQVNDVYHIDVRADNARDDSMILPRVATVLDNARRRLGPDRVHLCVPGDFLGPSCLSKYFRGKQMVAVLNALGTRFVSLGNHEFDTKGADRNLLECMDQSEFTWVATNFQFDDPAVEERFSGHPRMQPAALVKLCDGVHLVLLGLLYPGTFGGVGRATDPAVEAWRMIMTLEGKLAGGSATALGSAATYLAHLRGTPGPQYRGRAAYVALTHQHSADDRALADAVPHLMTLLGGHDHDVRHRDDRLGSHVGKALSNARTLRLNWFVAVPAAELLKIDGFGKDPAVLLGVADELYGEAIIPHTLGLLLGKDPPAAADFDWFRPLLLEYFGPGPCGPGALPPPARDVGGLVDAAAGRALSCRVVRDRFVFAYSLALDTQRPEFIDLVPEHPGARATIDSWLARSPECTAPILRSPVRFVLADAEVRRRSTNFGNFVADVLSGRRKDRNPARAVADFGLVNGGSFRLDREVSAGEPISRKLLCDIFYHDNRVQRFTLEGSAVERVVQACARLRAGPDDSHGDFLQVSGLRVTVKGGVPTSVECRDGTGGWSKVRGDGRYTVATTPYVAQQCGLYAPQFAGLPAEDLEPEVRVAVREEFEALARYAGGSLEQYLADLEEERWCWA